MRAGAAALAANDVVTDSTDRSSARGLPIAFCRRQPAAASAAEAVWVPLESDFVDRGWP